MKKEITFRRNGSSIIAIVKKTKNNGETTTLISDLELLIQVEPEYAWLEPLLRKDVLNN